MFNFEKLFAALLVAGITAMLSGFVADIFVHPHEIEKDAVTIDGAAIASTGPTKKAGPDPVLALLSEADVARGAKLSKACAACHSFDQGGVNKVGPNLWNIVNKAKGSHAGFSYSSAITEAGGSWDYDALNHFLYKPKAYISGTKMNYAGLKKTEDRAAMIAWLRTLSASPAALPGAAEIAAEAEAAAAE
ncbi:MAG: cytochrome c family protein [Alphaproteobacteria bacterium]|nr:cytochrome c family protein [Alphaproteobacteria bacterium]HCQ70698.1 cytochrome c family protein [Rhodospirillaceae bacterium]|tara:strand:- start:26013 stop:26582 length:570 start_codon:yes stop_codon:yes gene_type:complete